MIRARECLYEYLSVLIERLANLGYEVSIDAPMMRS